MSKHRAYCCVPRCCCCKQKQPYLSFHSFPSDPVEKDRWIHAVRREKWNISAGSGTLVCSRHFQTADYFETCKRLKPGVVPSLFPWNNYTAPKERPSVHDRIQKRQSTLAEDASAVKASRLCHDYAAPPPPGNWRVFTSVCLFA